MAVSVEKKRLERSNDTTLMVVERSTRFQKSTLMSVQRSTLLQSTLILARKSALMFVELVALRAVKKDSSLVLTAG
eukprot:2211505-Amphidinium_carterae.1